jgi:hypothetical protein
MLLITQDIILYPTLFRINKVVSSSIPRYSRWTRVYRTSSGTKLPESVGGMPIFVLDQFVRRGHGDLLTAESRSLKAEIKMLRTNLSTY